MKLPRLVEIGGKLAIICIVAAVVLGLVNSVTAPVIVENRARALAAGLTLVADQAGVPGVRVGEGSPISGSLVARDSYPITDGDGALAGYVLRVIGVGYGGDIEILAGYFPSGELFAAFLLDNDETPGLGKKAEKAEYMAKFIGFGADAPIPTSKSALPADQADAITGATITFLGVSRALAAGSEIIKSMGVSSTGGTL